MRLNRSRALHSTLSQRPAGDEFGQTWECFVASAAEGVFQSAEGVAGQHRTSGRCQPRDCCTGNVPCCCHPQESCVATSTFAEQPFPELPAGGGDHTVMKEGNLSLMGTPVWCLSSSLHRKDVEKLQ
ncbi:hypothetical protein KIL84_007970 [Mauremys mutica]|uniref:Uncharacterized protein n=1 Tax=Mauremys mutica TaxID=74926 RepID=A0A9D3X3Y6_9SAUR|nr:hypothetical protein KIL84_007970 [Mauremys mutica]